MLRLSRERIRIEVFREKIVFNTPQNPRKQNSIPAAFSIDLREWSIDELMSALAQGVSRLEDLKKVGVDVAISSKLVRYQLLTWSDALNSQEDWYAYAESVMASTFGVEAADLEIKVGWAPPKHPRIAAGIENSVCKTITSAFPQEKFRPISLKPALMVGVDMLREAVRGSDYWLVIAEPDISMVGYVSKEKWVSLRARQKMSDISAEQISCLVDKEEIVSNFECHSRNIFFASLKSGLWQNDIVELCRDG